MEKKTIILGYEEHGGNKFPIILCQERKDIPLVGAMEFYCESCKKIHRHGQGEGHRSPHCHGNEESPFKKTGYILTLNENYLDIKKTIKEYEEKENLEMIENTSAFLGDLKTLKKAFPNEKEETLLLIQILSRLYELE